MLLKTQTRMERCPMWLDITPNELYFQNEDYRTLLAEWAGINDIPKHDKMFEVRIVNQRSALEIHRSHAWWDQPEFMDQVFWVFVKPIQCFPDGPEGEPLPCYPLEFYECLRVMEVAMQKLGYNPFPEPHPPSLLVPVECVQIEWEETTGGYADNIREQCIARANAPKSNAEKEAEHQLQEIVKEKTKELQSIPGWETDQRKSKGKLF